ncbi:MAG TPA: glycosyltransferase family 9 protein [Candidatus Acidoferrales bacterium]|nr:glycosyltransferase family 9 protein [Candidatus Acidoferrales bacterium]
MERVLECLPQGGRVAVVRLRSLGDCVLTTPALDILKRFRGDLRIGVSIEPRFADLFTGHPDIDEILAPEPGAVRAFRPDLCLNLHGGTRSAWITACSGARFRAGFGHYRFSFLYNERIPRAQEILSTERVVHTAEHLASAVFHLGAPRCKIPRAKLPPYPDGVPPNLREDVAILHPAATADNKTWPAKNFAALAGQIRQLGLEPVFIGGPGDDPSPFREWRTVYGARLRDVQELVATAAIFVGNDSGPAHIAAAFGVPTVVIFGASDPAIWGPWRSSGEAISSPDGIAGVQVSQVMKALQRLRVNA